MNAFEGIEKWRTVKAISTLMLMIPMLHASQINPDSGASFGVNHTGVINGALAGMLEKLATQCEQESRDITRKTRGGFLF